MSKNNSLQEFTARFRAASTQSLVEEFNRQVGNTGRTSSRANHDQALISEFQNRGVDTSAVYDGHSIDFSQYVWLDEAAGRLSTRLI